MARSQRSLFLLAIPLVVLLTAGYFFMGTDPVQGPQPLGEGSVAPVLPTPDGGPVAELEGETSGPAQDQPLRELVAKSEGGAEARSAAPQRVVRGARVPRASHFVYGQVEFPEGTPLDEELFVIASGRRFKTLAGHPDEYAAPVDTDGNFRVAFAEGTRKGRLWIAARYCFSENHKVIDPTSLEDTTDLLLKPSLGGRLDVEVVAPRAAAGDLEFHEEVTVELRQDRNWGGGGSRAGTRTRDVHFEIGGVDPGEKFLVEARHPDFANGEVKGIKAEPGEVTLVVVNFGRGATLSGEIKNFQGEPITHASVMALTVEQANKRNPFMNEKIDEQVETGDGTFELVGVPAGDLMLLASADGYMELRVPLGEVGEGENRTSLLLQMDRGQIVEGSVAWPKGSPASGAMVRLSQKTDFMGFDYEAIMGEIKVGAEGKFFFSGLGEGQCHLEATSFERGYVAPAEASLRERLLDPPPVWRAVTADVKPGRRGLVMILSEGQTIPGQVLDDEGNPVPRFQIVATPAENNILSNTARKPIKDRFRSKAGRFDLEGLQDGAWVLVARGLGFGTGDEQEIVVPYDGEVVLRLPRESKMVGVVRDPSGKPIQGAQVLGRHGGGKDARTESGEDGVFNLVRLNPGEVTLSATHSSWARSSEQTLHVAAGEISEGALLTLRRGATLTVELHNAVGVIEGRQINLNGSGWGREETDAKGSVVFKGLEPGHYTVSMEAAQRGGRRDRDQWMLNRANREEIKVELLDEEQRAVVLGVPSPTAVTVQGAVTAAGEGVAKAVVSVLDPKNSSGQVAAVVADVDGNYELVLDEPGDYKFMVGREWSSQGVFAVTIGEGTRQREDFELPDASLLGVVRSASGVLEGAALALTPTVDGKEVGSRGSGRRSIRSGPDGHYSFSDLNPGTYNLRVMEANPGEATWGAILIEGLEIEDGGSTQDIYLELAGKIGGTVRDADGNGLRRARLNVTTESGTNILINSWTRSRGGGSYTINGLGPGDVWVIASYEGRTSSRVKVGVRKGSTTQYDIVIP